MNRDEYVDVSPDFGEKLLFLFTGLIKKDHIISNTIINEDKKPTEVQVTSTTDNGFEVELTPFFEVKDDTKSNL